MTKSRKLCVCCLENKCALGAIIYCAPMSFLLLSILFFFLWDASRQKSQSKIQVPFILFFIRTLRVFYDLSAHTAITSSSPADDCCCLLSPKFWTLADVDLQRRRRTDLPIITIQSNCFSCFFSPLLFVLLLLCRSPSAVGSYRCSTQSRRASGPPPPYWLFLFLVLALLIAILLFSPMWKQWNWSN